MDRTGLAHYTRGEGFLGILQTRRLRASHLFYLNDSSEDRYGLDRVRHLIHNTGIKEIAEILPELDKAIDGALSPYLRGRFPPIFVASLSEEWDDLSQWRGYSSPGDSYAVMFDCESLARSASDQGWRLEKCLYGTQGDQLLFDHIVAAFNRRAVGDHESDSQIAAQLRSAIEPVLPLVKHHSFISENEWRLISPVLDDMSSPLKYRSAASYVVPYVEFPLEDPPARPIVHVNIGPGPIPELAGNSVGEVISQYSHNCGYGYAQAPYRPW